MCMRGFEIVTIEEIIQAELCPCGGSLHEVDGGYECSECGWKIVERR